MRVIISAGGTGGHIYPAISIINKIKKEEPDSEFLYIGTKNRMESKIVPSLNIPYFGINIIGLKKDLSVFKSLYLFFKGIGSCKKKIKEFNPDIVIGVGGYITAPVIYSAKKLGYKTVIHEQNSIPGKSNRFLEKYTDKIMISLPGSEKYFNKEKTVLTGNPRSEEAYLAKKFSLKDIGLDSLKQTVLIVMGSLGSESINKELMDIIPKFSNKKYQVLIVTGKDHFESFNNLSVSSNVKIVPYLDNMVNILKSISLIVSRAGASTIAEITAIGLPSILVPSPYVANNHQYYNALELVNEEASIMLEEKDFNSNNLLKKIDFILDDSVLYKKMHKQALKLGKNDSCDKIYQTIKKIIRG